ncbi:hypothetical protein [Kribbella endophytica]
MASNLDCLGLGVDSPEAFADLVERIGPHAVVVGAGPDDVELLRWQDPSGARLLLTRGKRGITRVTPSYAGERVVQLSDIHRESDEAAVADVLENGDTVTRLAIELEELPLLGDAKHAGAANIVALAPDAQFFPNPEAFATSDASRLSTDDVQPLALLNGTVRYAERRTTMLTGQDFVVARLQTAGFQADLCLPATTPVPLPGTVVTTTAFLTGSLDITFAQPRRKWFSRH